MLPPKSLGAAGSPDERRLTYVFRALDPANRRTLLAFANFLAQDQAPAAEGLVPESLPEEPLAIARPAQESVIAAIRRLGLCYPMLDRQPMLHETSGLVSAHMLQGRPAADVIDELEALFTRHYEDYRARHAGSAGTGNGA